MSEDSQSQSPKKSIKKRKNKSKKDESDDEYNVESDESDDNESEESQYEPPLKKQRRTRSTRSTRSNNENNNNNNNNNNSSKPSTKKKTQTKLARYLVDSSDNNDDNEESSNSEESDSDIDSNMTENEKIIKLTNNNNKLKNTIKTLKNRIKTLENENKKLKTALNTAKKTPKRGRIGNNSNNNNDNSNENDPNSKENLKYRSKMFVKWSKASVRVANKKSNKFQRGYGTIIVEDHLTPNEFNLLFPKNCGNLIQPTKNNKPKSVVTIKSFENWDKINLLFNDDNIIGNGKNREKNKLPNKLTVHCWSVGGINFSKSRYLGTDTAIITSLNVNYNKSKKQLKLEFNAQSEDDPYFGSGFGRRFFFLM